MSTIDPTAWVAPGAHVSGNVAVGPDCSIWYNAVIRAEEEPITIGASTNVQDCAVIHVSRGHPVTLGEGVTIGHGAIIHGCTVGDNSLIGMGATVLDGAIVGRDCIVGTGSLVTQGTVIKDGSVAFGSPARVVRQMREEDISANRTNAAEYVRQSREARL